MSLAPPSTTRPVRRIAAAATQCSTEATIYGKCIVADYNSVHKNKCAEEFLRLKNCFMIAMKSKA
ncbi:hypothetical protein CFIMG_000218RA [Ceratocystis fimbriata CBS 114723]|uniref:IMS import disulfide relay-system CHCH-CHCH-like Cx9C domain-containing protein n=1 Tax=Ceratocystis fimbriata CBS 114723 TaxID=1035309 RepID=A0A2C5WMJ5_9PEZI|nr:hypothetical protein CFIMG_000218RA [Ceratocystis fimbriata CBS 114723]